MTWRIVRVTVRDGVYKDVRRYVDGPMSCSCIDPEPTCGPDCARVMIMVGVLAASVAWVCLTGMPPPVPVP